jgi:hypothetical protein
MSTHLSSAPLLTWNSDLHSFSAPPSGPGQGLGVVEVSLKHLCLYLGFLRRYDLGAVLFVTRSLYLNRRIQAVGEFAELSRALQLEMAVLDRASTLAFVNCTAISAISACAFAPLIVCSRLPKSNRLKVATRPMKEKPRGNRGSTLS